ncbi:MAG: DUF134 domain-containing protein [Clostridia bacterium]|nr:DUF134 domain-containing protein [Clostridia bacterium]
MGRPKKRKRVCSVPKDKLFGPLCHNDDTKVVVMTIEEYETIRLIDHNNLTQEQCCQHMNIARTSVQRLYDDARKKIADALINDKVISVSGGEYEECNGQNFLSCGCECEKKITKVDKGAHS